MMLKYQFQKRKSIIQEKIPNISGFVKKKTGYNDKNTITESKIPTISGLAITAPLMQLKVRYLMLVIQ